MPKQTFFNLNEAKKNKIIECALDEFATYDFNSASINRIVEKAQIAKGSFYQYFDDKKDLFKYIIEHIVEQKIQYFTHCQDSGNFFNYIKSLYSTGIKFSAENPRYAAIALFLHKNTELRSEILGNMEEINQNYFKTLLEKGQENKSIRKDVNLDVASYLLYQLNMAMAELYFKSHPNWECNEDFKTLTHSVIDIMENGLKNRDD